MFRLDEDCIAASDLRWFLSSQRRKSIELASPMWVNLSGAKTDKISQKQEGVFVRNMRQFVIDFANRSRVVLSPGHRLIDSWSAPYTNSMYLNLTWYRNTNLLQQFKDHVLHSKCIYSGRWGDLPLWGANALLTGLPQRVLNFSYSHLSHRVKVEPFRKYSRVFS